MYHTKSSGYENLSVMQGCSKELGADNILMVLAHIFNRQPLPLRQQDTHRDANKRRRELPPLPPAAAATLSAANAATLSRLVAYLAHHAQVNAEMVGGKPPALSFSGTALPAWGCGDTDERSAAVVDALKGTGAVASAHVRGAFAALRGVGDNFATAEELQLSASSTLEVQLHLPSDVHTCRLHQCQCQAAR